jgi:hypothetical protein
MFGFCLGQSHVPKLSKIYDGLAEIRPVAMSQSNERYKTETEGGRDNGHDSCILCRPQSYFLLTSKAFY